MKKTFTLAISSFALVCLHAQQGGRKEVLPTKNQFNSAEAKEMLSYGKSTIKGVAVAREYTDANISKNPLNAFMGSDLTGTKHLAPEGTVVMLFPVTEYFKEYQKLRERYAQSRKYVAVMSKEAFAHRIETKVGKNGTFVFEKMKPGKYYIETYFNYVGTGLGHEEVGRTHYYNGYGYMGSSPIYQSYFYNYTGGKVESKTVTIKEDGSTIEIKL